MQNRFQRFMNRITDLNTFEAENDELEEAEESDEPEDVDKLAGFIDTGYLPHYTEAYDDSRAE